jgi:hypothetical protein
MVCLRTSLKNQLQALALGQGTYRKQKLGTSWGRTELEALVLDPWAHRRRQELLQMLDQLAPLIAELDRAAAEEAAQRTDARRLMEQPYVCSPVMYRKRGGRGAICFSRSRAFRLVEASNFSCQLLCAAGVSMVGT